VKNNIGMSGSEVKKAMRQLIYDKYGGKCYMCGINVILIGDSTNDAYMNIDHIVPRSKGGETIASNLACSCKACNEKKSDSELNLFLYTVGV
jgi:5-methylcytosine-specific restriction endonuclease McrA